MVVLAKALGRAFPDNERARHGIVEAARVRIAKHLGQGIRSIERQLWNRFRTETDPKVTKAMLVISGTANV